MLLESRAQTLGNYVNSLRQDAKGTQINNSQIKLGVSINQDLMTEAEMTNAAFKDQLDANAALRAKLAIAIEALKYYADEKRWPAVAPSPLKARTALKETDDAK